MQTTTVPDTAKKATGKISFRTVRNAVARHPLLLTGLIALSSAVAVGVWIYMPLPKHTGIVGFQLSTNPPRVISASSENQIDLRTYGNLQSATLKRRQFLSNVLKHPEMVGVLKPDAVGWLEAKLQVDFKNGLEFMRVTMEGDDPNELMAILKAVSATYLTTVDDRDNGNRSQRLSLIEKSIGIHQEETSAKTRRIDVIASNLKTTDAATLLLIEGLNRDELRVAKKEVIDLQRKVDLAKAELPDPALPATTPIVPAVFIEEAIKKDSTWLLAEAKVTTAKQLLRDTESRYEPGSTNVNITKAKQEVKTSEENREKLRVELRGQLEAVVKTKWESDAKIKAIQLKEAYDQLVRQRGVAERDANSIVEQINKLGVYQTELEKLRKEVNSSDKTLSTLSGERDSIRVEQLAPRRVVMTEEPFVQNGVEGFRRLRMILMCSLGVFVIGFAVLVFWEHRSRRVTRADELTSSFGFPVLGSIPFSKPDEPKANRALVEAVDAIRTQLLYSRSKDRPLRTMLICSGLSGEGKTTLSGHLTVSLARAGYRVLMVDGDLHAPTAQRLFDLPATPGLCEVLRDGTPFTDAIHGTPVPGLFVMPAGSWNMATRQCLVGDRWEMVREQLQQEFDFVVVDTAPTLLMADTLLLAKACDGVILSVLLGFSRLGAVGLTHERFQKMGVRLLGAVVNGAAAEFVSNYYGRYKYTGSLDAANADPVPLSIA